jgi:hypothetical protein
MPRLCWCEASPESNLGLARFFEVAIPRYRPPDSNSRMRRLYAVRPSGATGGDNAFGNQNRIFSIQSATG